MEIVAWEEEFIERAKADFMEVVSHFPNEVGSLRQAIIEGRIHGSMYGGPCCCLKGTLANAKWGVVDSFGNWEQKSIERLEGFGILCSGDLPAEEFFYQIQQGDTPETFEYSAIALDWCNEFLRASDKVFLVVSVAGEKVPA